MSKMIYLFLLAAVGFSIFLAMRAFGSDGGDEQASPKAVHWIPKGNHIENLKAHEDVKLSPTDKIANINDLPVWIMHSENDSQPSTYEGVLWEIEPMGEYLYYLAGDYSKNEKGLLRFPTASISFRVEHSFEDDVIRVGRAESQEEIELAIAGGELPKGKLLSEIADSYDSSIGGMDWRFGFATLKRIVPDGASGNARVVFLNNPYKKALVAVFKYEEFRKPKCQSEYERFVKIHGEISDLSLPVDAVVSHMRKLIEKYHDMQYLSVSGAVRM